tara:strand:- start:168 stop:572 length:405 start_codon:yes stop_codon:yes gene_type:complete
MGLVINYKLETEGSFRGYTYNVGTFQGDYSQEEIDIIKLCGLSTLTSWLVGFVKIPEATCYRDLEKYNNIICHGGTISYKGQVESQSGFWIGFYCNHLQDRANKKDEKFVISECEMIIMQLLDKDNFDNLYRIN